MGSFSSFSSAIVSLTYCTLACPLAVISFFLSLQVVALWCPLQKVHLPIEDSGLEVMFVHMIPQCPCCPHLAQILMVVCGMLEPLSSGGGVSLWICYMWFSWFAFQLLLGIWRCLWMFSSIFICSSFHATMAFNLLLNILSIDLGGSLLLASAGLSHSCGLSLVVSIIGLFW